MDKADMVVISMHHLKDYSLFSTSTGVCTIPSKCKYFQITAFATPAEAYARLALALTEVRRYLIPDSNDEIRQRQMKEIQVGSHNSLTLKSGKNVRRKNGVSSLKG